MIESDLVALLKATGSLTAIVGQRIYPHHIPQTSPLPALSMFVVTKPGQHHLTAPSWKKARIQISCWSTTYSEALALAANVRTLLDGYSGSMGGTVLGEVLLDNEINLYEPPDDGSDQGIYHAALDFIFCY